MTLLEFVGRIGVALAEEARGYPFLEIKAFAVDEDRGGQWHVRLTTASRMAQHAVAPLALVSAIEADTIPQYVARTLLKRLDMARANIDANRARTFGGDSHGPR